MNLSLAAIERAHEKARASLLADLTPNSHWVGELSSSALSTATAAVALTLYGREERDGSRYFAAAQRGIEWLVKNQNRDGGWGDTTLSKSNISTTALCWAAFGAVPEADATCRTTVALAERWLEQHAGGTDVESLSKAIIGRYGKDRTFSVPILTMCALSGRFGPGPDAWRTVIPLPFELAALPQSWFAAVRMPVVSYALPALIAIGQARYAHRPPRNPAARLVRHFARGRTLKILETIQPESGGFLEATPLTSFVVMSLAGSGLSKHPVAAKGIEFILNSERTDGSWPIDTNLSTWVSTLSINALGPGLPANTVEPLVDWLLQQQYKLRHPYTGAAPGGWAWTDLPGGVPDADDTAGAVLALSNLRLAERTDARAASAIANGAEWLMGVQNSDGGIPTFCRGWGHLPFDMSSPDITAHAVRAWEAAARVLGSEHPLHKRLSHARTRAIRYLLQAQKAEGSWIPLWFGNEHDPADENHVYGTARVIDALIGDLEESDVRAAVERAVAHLTGLQSSEGGWSGAKDGSVSVEETALAVESLSGAARAGLNLPGDCLDRGIAWLATAVEENRWTAPTPIGFYFAKLWYHERLYPKIFAAGALRAAAAIPR